MYIHSILIINSGKLERGVGQSSPTSPLCEIQGVYSGLDLAWIGCPHVACGLKMSEGPGADLDFMFHKKLGHIWHLPGLEHLM